MHDFSLTRSRKKKKKVLLLPFTQAMANAFLKQLNATLLLQVSFIAIYHSLAAQLSCFLGPTMTSLCRVSFFYYFFYPSVSPQPHHSGGGEDLGRVLSCKLSLERRVARKRGVGSKHKAVVLFIPVT